MAIFHMNPMPSGHRGTDGAQQLVTPTTTSTQMKAMKGHSNVSGRGTHQFLHR